MMPCGVAACMAAPPHFCASPPAAASSALYEALQTRSLGNVGLNCCKHGNGVLLFPIGVSHTHESSRCVKGSVGTISMVTYADTYLAPASHPTLTVPPSTLVIMALSAVSQKCVLYCGLETGVGALRTLAAQCVGRVAYPILHRCPRRKSETPFRRVTRCRAAAGLLSAPPRPAGRLTCPLGWVPSRSALAGGPFCREMPRLSSHATRWRRGMYPSLAASAAVATTLVTILLSGGNSI
eukprot:355489-Chlamydomonas_euryale.AAC.6